MKIAASPRSLVVGLALAGSVGLGGALAASAATATPDHSAGTVSMSGQGLDTTAGTTAGTTAPASGTTRTGSAVGLVEASRIAALIGHGHVSKAEQESTATGVVYEVTVVQPDGTERTVTVDRTTGRVLANTLEDASDGNDATDRPDAADRPDAVDRPDTAGDRPDTAGDHQERDHTDSRTGDEAH